MQAGSQIVYLTGLEHATNLGRLELNDNQIVDVESARELNGIKSVRPWL